MIATVKDAMRIDKSALVAELQKVGARFHGNSCTCPYHEDSSPSAAVHEDKMGTWRITCHAASCGFSGDYWDVRSKNEHKTLADLFDEGSEIPAVNIHTTIESAEQSVPGQIESRYKYTCPTTGKIELIIVRAMTPTGKTFRQISPMAGGFALKAPPKPWPIYNRGRIIAATTVIVVEGESCVHALHEYGIVATTSPCGAGKAHHADWSLLAGKNVVLWPDADDGGRKHMDAVQRILEDLEPVPRISMLDPEELELGPKEDVVDYIKQLKVANCDIKQELEEAFSNAQLVGGSGVGKHINACISGEFSSVRWPWNCLTDLSKALMSKTVTLLCGSAGASKSFMLLQALAEWHDQGIKVACFELEEDKCHHMMRVLAQRSGLAGLTDPDWIRANAEQSQQAAADHKDFMDSFDARISAAPDTEQTRGQLHEWIKTKAKAGCRIIAIDPITAIVQTDKPWIKDGTFVNQIKHTASEYECSVILVTHPTKTFSTPDMNQLAGGAAYSRFTQAVIWLDSHEPKTSRTKGPHGIGDVQHNRTVRILKARSARGAGCGIAYQFHADSLTMTELGLVVQE